MATEVDVLHYQASYADFCQNFPKHRQLCYN